MADTVTLMDTDEVTKADLGALFTPEDLAARWNTAISTLANMRCQGQGPDYVKIGKLVRYRPAAVLAHEQLRTIVMAKS